MAEERVFVALGSNLGDREAHLSAALRGLARTPGVEVWAASPVYETAAVGPPPQGPYLNAVLQLRSSLGPRALLARQLEIEAEQGRERGAVSNMARTLDIDLLLYGSQVFEKAGLTLPHPRMCERAFVLQPLCDLAPRLRHPLTGERIEELAARVFDPAALKLWSEQIAHPTVGA